MHPTDLFSSPAFSSFRTTYTTKLEHTEEEAQTAWQEIRGELLGRGVSEETFSAYVNHFGKFQQLYERTIGRTLAEREAQTVFEPWASSEELCTEMLKKDARLEDLEKRALSLQLANTRSPRHGNRTPLEVAALNGKIIAVQLLLNAGACVTEEVLLAACQGVQPRQEPSYPGRLIYLCTDSERYDCLILLMSHLEEPLSDEQRSRLSTSVLPRSEKDLFEVALQMPPRRRVPTPPSPGGRLRGARELRGEHLAPDYRITPPSHITVG